MNPASIPSHTPLPLPEFEALSGSSSTGATAADAKPAAMTSGRAKLASERSVSPNLLKAVNLAHQGKIDLPEPPAAASGPPDTAASALSASAAARALGTVTLTTPGGSTHALTPMAAPAPTAAELRATQIKELTRHLVVSSVALNRLRDRHQAQSAAMAGATGAQLTAAQGNLATVQRGINDLCFDMEGAAAALVVLRRTVAPAAGGRLASVLRSEVNAAIDGATHATGAAGAPYYQGMYPRGPGGAPWALDAAGAMDRASVAFSALGHAQNAHAAAPADPGHAATGARLEAGRRLLLSDLAGADAGLHERLSAFAETHHLPARTGAPSSAPAATAQALATVMAADVKQRDNPALSASFAALQTDAERCAALGDLVGHSDFKRELDAMHANKGVQFYAQALGGSVLPSSIAASLHSLFANLAGDGVSARKDYDATKLADTIGKAGAATGAGLGAAVPIVNNGVVPSVIGLLELAGARTLQATDPKRVYPAKPELVVDAQLQPHALAPAARQPEQDAVLLQRDNFIKQQAEYTFGGATGKTIGYLAYGIGNGARVMFEAAGTLSARVLQTGASQAVATTAMTLAQASQRIDGYPAFGLGEAQGWDRVKKGGQKLNPLAEAPPREFLTSVASSMEGLYLNKLVNAIPDLPHTNAKLVNAVRTGVAMAPLLTPIFVTTEEDKAKQLERAAKAGIIAPEHALRRTALATQNLLPSNWNGAHRDHQYGHAGALGALSSLHGVVNAATEVVPTIIGDVAMGTVDAMTGRNTAAVPRRRP